MSSESTPSPSSPARAALDLVAVSVLLLFLELACIRWFPAHVLFLTFFTNTVLLACFLGMSLGCLAVGHSRNYLAWTPLFLCIALGAGLYANYERMELEKHLNVGNQASPQFVYFGTEYHAADPTQTKVPIEVIAGFFFVMIALALVGPGQELGRALRRLPNRVAAYSFNILGSIAGIVLFAAVSWFQLSPVWWFLPVVVGIAYFLIAQPGVAARRVPYPALLLLALVVLLSTVTSWPLWSPYYRIDYNPETKGITVNLIGHQQMVPRDDISAPAFAYALPHILRRDVQRDLGEEPKPFQDVLIIGAGSGNDVSRALQWGAGHVDAVEIDPVIQKLGARDHPDKPYADLERVTVHLDDGRNFLHSTDRKYDLILYALVDSLVLHSGYSNIRLESYLFTEQAFQDVKNRLKPGGIFVMYNYFRQGWIVSRLVRGLEKVFGEGNPLVLALPYMEAVKPDDMLHDNFTVIIAGNTAPLRQAFERHNNTYLLAGQRQPGLDSPDGFKQTPPEAERDRWARFGPARLVADSSLRVATDDWPFLYLREPMIPDLSLRGAAVMGGLAVVLLLLFLPRSGDSGTRWSFDGRMFFLGAGFMLIETKAVVHMALLFGSTWMVNSVVFFAVLVMILASNLFVLRIRPENLWPYYLGLAVALLLNIAIPLDFFLGMNRAAQVVGSCLLVFAPILFAGVIFAVSFGRTTEPDRAFGANIAGAMAGGLAEYTSMLLGFHYLVLVALAFYGLSALLGGKGAQPTTPDEKLAESPAV